MEKKNNSLALKASLWYIVSTFILKCIGILVTPIVARMMTKSEYGMVATYGSWHAMISIFFSLNLTYSVGRAKLDFPDKLDDYIGSCQLLAATTSIILISLILLFEDYFLPIFGMNKLFLLLLLISLFFEPAIEFFQTGCRYRYRYKQNIAIAIFTAILGPMLSIILMHLNTEQMALYRIIGSMVPTILISLIIWSISVYNNNLHFNIAYWKYAIVLSLPLIFHTLSLHLLALSDRIFISKICGDEYVGAYSLVYSYGIILNTISRTINLGWLPWFHDTYFANDYQQIRNNVKPLVLLACYICLACVAFAPEAIMYLGGEKYIDGVYCVLPVVIGVLCQYIYTHYVNIELHLKKTKFVSFGTFLAATINIILNLIFIPKYGYIAAAYTTLASYLALMLIHFLFTRIILKVNLYNNKFMFGSILLTSTVAVLVQATFNNLYMRYSIILLGFILFLITFKSYFGFVINYLKRKLDIKSKIINQ